MALPKLAATAVWMGLIAHGCIGQGVASPQDDGRQPIAQTTRASISGIVTCNDTRRAARGALVTLIPLPANENYLPLAVPAGITRVGINGTYSVENVAPGDYAVVAFMAGYLSAIDRFGSNDSRSVPVSLRRLLTEQGSITLRAGDTAHVDLVLERGAALSGRVQYSDGTPAAGVRLELEDVNARPESADTANYGGIVVAAFPFSSAAQPHETNDLGSFRLAGLPPGTYRIAALPVTSRSPFAGAPTLGYLAGGNVARGQVRLYSGDTLHRKEAKIYELQSGAEESDVLITIPTDGFHAVRGELRSRDGKVINMASLTLSDPSDSALSFHIFAKSDGSFAFSEIPDGNYNLSVQDAHIGRSAQGVGVPAGEQGPYSMMKAIATFADMTVSVLVKDDDVSQLMLALDEVTPRQAPGSN